MLCDGIMLCDQIVPTATTKAPLPVPPQLLALAPQLGVEEQAPNVLRQSMLSSYTTRVPHISFILKIKLIFHCLLYILLMIYVISHSTLLEPGITSAPFLPEGKCFIFLNAVRNNILF